METLLVAQHRNHYSGKSKSNSHGRFGSSPSRNFRGINCRTFQSGTDMLSVPLNSYNSPVNKQPQASSPKTLSPPANSSTEDKKHVKTIPKSTPIPISGKNCNKERYLIEDIPEGCLYFSELWAGPTYSNSPPPSSLPIPKFSVRPKRTVSLDLPGSSPEIEMHPVAKSAPSSPTRELSSSTRDLFLNADSATKTLRRILNLNIDDE